MRLAMERRAGRRAIGLGIIAVAAVASLAWAWRPKSPQSPQISATEVIALRFPAEWTASTPTSAATYVLAHALSREKTPREPAPSVDPFDWLSQALLFEQARQDFITGPNPGMPLSRFELPDNAAVSAAPPPSSRERASPASLLNEAQIASIKERLNLTPEQAALWLPVEEALRTVAWRGNPDKLDTKSATLDPRGIVQLKTALTPFLKTLNAEQKDELRMIAHLMGLGPFASQL